MPGRSLGLDVFRLGWKEISLLNAGWSRLRNVGIAFAVSNGTAPVGRPHRLLVPEGVGPVAFADDDVHQSVRGAATGEATAAPFNPACAAPRPFGPRFALGTDSASLRSTLSAMKRMFLLAYPGPKFPHSKGAHSMHIEFTLEKKPKVAQAVIKAAAGIAECWDVLRQIKGRIGRDWMPHDTCVAYIANNYAAMFDHPERDEMLLQLRDRHLFRPLKTYKPALPPLLFRYILR